MKNNFILFFHGMLGTGADWEPVASFLPDFDCFAIDLPGHGETPFVNDFFDLLPRFQDPFHLVGYSMGGRLAMQYASQFPQRIASLTIASAHFGLKDPKEREARYALDLNWAKQFLEKPIDDVLKCWYDQPLFKSFRVDLNVRRKQNVEGIAQAFVHYSLGKQEFLQPKNAFYLVGEYDEKYRALYKNVNPLIIPKAGHAIHLENPRAFAEAIRNNLCGTHAVNTPI